MAQDVVRLPLSTSYRPSERKYDVSEPLPLRRAIRTPVLLGWALIAAFVVGFGAWSTTVPLASGAVAPGIISPDGSRRVVQHLEGGIIAEIRARDGDYVEKGEPVMLLQDIQAASVYDELLDEYRTLLATRARLTAELFGDDQVVFPPELTEVQGDRVAAITESQRAIFKSRRELQLAQKQVLEERLLQSAEQIRALEAQIESATTQIALLADEIAGKKTLLEDALTTKSQLLALQRQEAELEGRRGEYQAMIAEINQKRGEIESQLLAIDAESNDYVASELDKTRASLASVSERLSASRDILERTVVTAPVSGRVVNSRFKSPGGVVIRGEPIMEIVPTDERLLIDARVAIVDIDVVHPGQSAAVHLTALESYRLPRIEGIVQSVSADRIIDEASGQSYYLARVEVPRERLDEISGIAELVPGMPAEVLIVTGERTMLDYLLEPFKAVFRRSFREG